MAIKLNYSQYEINLMLSLAKPDNLRKIHIFQHYFDEARKISRITNQIQKNLKK